MRPGEGFLLAFMFDEERVMQARYVFLSANIAHGGIQHFPLKAGR